MFEFFKNKKSKNTKITGREEVLLNSSILIKMQLTAALFSSEQIIKHMDFLKTDYARGYLIGFFEASLQHAKMSPKNDQEFIACMVQAHIKLIGKDLAIDFIKDTFPFLLSDEEKELKFWIGRYEAQAEYSDFLKGKIKSPRKLNALYYNLSDLKPFKIKFLTA